MPKPNLLFIFTDEQRYDTLACYGNTQIEMPNLNRLASQSVVFDQAYVTQPVCTPSRSTIMTGLYPHTDGCTENNAPLPPEIPVLTEMLQDDDYVTAYHGKWHLGDELFQQHGFDEWISIEDGYDQHYGPGRDPNVRSTYHHFLIENGFTPRNGETFGRGEATRLPEAFGKPAYLAREASRFIRENKANPFVLYVNYLEPHMPYYGPRDDQYDPADLPLPDNYQNAPTETEPLKTRVFSHAYHLRGHSGLPLKTDDNWRRLIANYWGLNSLVDTHTGTILDTLAECGLEENTIVVYTSDHGDMMGSHRLLAKCVMFEEATRVPLLIRLPGQQTSRRVNGPVSQVDLVPTLLDLMGKPIPDNLEGKSLAPWLEQGGDVMLSDDVFIEWSGPNNGFGDVAGSVVLPPGSEDLATPEQVTAAVLDAVRTIVTADGWKLNYSPLGEHELYNLRQDPLETTNLAADAAHRPMMKALAERIVSWQGRTDDGVEVRPEQFG